MSVPITQTFVLTGPLAGKTVNLGSQPFPFKGGELTITATPQDMGLLSRFLERNWQAYPADDPRVKEVTNGQRNIPETSGQPVSGEVQSSGEGAPASDSSEVISGVLDTTAGNPEELAEGNGQTESIDQRLLEAVRKLDPENDSHWTRNGKPALDVVAKFYGSSNVTRGQVDESAPGIVRPTK